VVDVDAEPQRRASPSGGPSHIPAQCRPPPANDSGDFFANFRLHFGGQRLAQLGGTLGILKHQRLLQEFVGMQARGQDEMALEQRARFLEFKENLFDVHDNLFITFRQAQGEDSEITSC
jgi:hypothetical protein